MTLRLLSNLHHFLFTITYMVNRTQLFLFLVIFVSHWCCLWRFPYITYIKLKHKV